MIRRELKETRGFVTTTQYSVVCFSTGICMIVTALRSELYSPVQSEPHREDPCMHSCHLRTGPGN